MEPFSFQFFIFFSASTLLLLLWCPVDAQQGACLTAKQAEEYSVYWAHIPPHRLFQMFRIPIGLQNQEFLYLCRVKQSNGKYISGKLRVGETTRCLVANNGGATSHEKFEMLVHPEGVISWIPMPSDGVVPPGAIASGMSDAGKVQHICRGFHKVAGRIDIIPGKWASYKKKCYVVVDGRQFAATIGEIAILNALATAVGIEPSGGGMRPPAEEEEGMSQGATIGFSIV